MVLSSERIAHMHGVAEYMYANAEKYGLDKEEMYVLGLLHDIGHLRGNYNHEENGQALLHKMGFVYNWEILWHTISPQNYKLYTPKEDLPPSLILLLEANMKISLSGEEIDYDKKILEIANTYGLASEVYNMVEETIQWLEEREQSLQLTANEN